MSLWLYIYVYMYVCINLFVCLFILKSNAWGKNKQFACGNFGHKVSLSVSMNSKFHKHDISISMLFYLLIFLLLINL